MTIFNKLAFVILIKLISSRNEKIFLKNSYHNKKVI